MPTEVVNLDELVPGIAGLDFVYRDKTYHVPGDLDTTTVMEFLALYQDLVVQAFEQSQVEIEGLSTEEQVKLANDLRATMSSQMDLARDKLLTVFQITDPELKTLPFGHETTMIVLGKILHMMGIAADKDEEPLGELPVPPTKTPRKPRDRQPKAPRKPRTTS